MSQTPSHPPVTDPVSPYESFNSKKLHDAAERALDHYLAPAKVNAAPYSPNTLFMVNPESPPNPCWSMPANPWPRPR
ncbi:hypothetical protein QE391_002267 [Pseudomonas fluorescens]|nr:hypothetical protein [Pseudomonas fluorescens]